MYFMGLLKRYKDIFRTINKFSKGYIVLTITVKLFTLCNTYVLLYVNRHVINTLNAVILLGENHISPIILALLCYIVVDVLSTIIFNCFQYHLGKLKLKYDDAMLLKLAKSIASLDMAYYDDTNSYNQTKQAAKYNSSILINYNCFLDLCFSIISLLIAMSFSVKFSVLITIISVVLTVPSFLIKRKIKIERHDLEKNTMNYQRFTDYLFGVFSNRNAQMEMQLYGFEEYLLNKIDNSQRHLRTIRLSFGLKKARDELFLSVLNKGQYFIYQVLLISTIVKNKMTIGDYSYYGGIITNLSSSVNNIINLVNDIHINDIKYQEYLKIINRKSHINTYGTIKPEKDNFTLSFDNVSFKYPNSCEYTLKKISFTIRKGERVAIVGRNGAGKSTLIKLILRFYEPTEGAIFLNGIDIRQYDLTSYRKLFSAMFQELMLYLLPIRENIGLSDVNTIDSPESDIRIKDILCDLGINYINNAEMDLFKYYGKEFYPDGYILSKGQQQRIHAARTLYHQCNMIILDEPVASMDSVSEANFLQTLEAYAHSNAIVYITHRYNNLNQMDTIYLLDGGEIVEQGTHDQLLAQNGLYAYLFSKQNNEERERYCANEESCISKAY